MDMNWLWQVILSMIVSRSDDHLKCQPRAGVRQQGICPGLTSRQDLVNAMAKAACSAAVAEQLLLSITAST